MQIYSMAKVGFTNHTLRSTWLFYANSSLALYMIGLPRRLSLTFPQTITDDVSNYSFVKQVKIVSTLPLCDKDAVSPANSKQPDENGEGR